MVLLDTCALLWWTLKPEELSENAAKVCGKIPTEGAYISSITIWEIGIKMQKGALILGKSFENYVSRIKSLGTIEIIPVDEEVWMRNILLEWEHRDPADRTIVATAALKKLPIMTKDQIILDFFPDTVW